MNISNITKRWALVAGMVFGFAPNAFADGGDSSADAGSFTEVVKAAKGVIIQVPINEQGQELPEQADIRVYGGERVIDTNTDAIAGAFSQATPAAAVPEISQADVDRDSSTSWGWYGGYRGYGRGWSSGYYYNYRPSYYYSGSYYRYGSPYYYNNYYGYSYGGYSYYGSRYYYYPYYWN